MGSRPMPGCIIPSPGMEWKKFNTRDGMGIKLLQKAGLITAIITQRVDENRHAPRAEVDDP